MVELTQIEFLQGIFTLIFVFISIILGLKICLKYAKYKRRELYLAGMTLILMVAPYYSSVTDFIMILLFKIPSGVFIIYIGIALVAFANLTWMILITDLLYSEKQKIILTFIIAQLIIFEVFLVYSIVIDPTLILLSCGENCYRESSILIFYYIFSLLLFLITGFLFARGALKTDDKEICLKGRFIIIALISYVIGAILDFAFEVTALTVTLARLIQISAFTEFYLGFALPDFLKKLLIKED
jgi:hypothetical protein